MELKLKLRMALYIMAFFLILICFDWYTNIDYVKVVKIEDSSRVRAKELLELKGSYDLDPSKEYNWESYRTVKITKGSLPYMFDEEILNQTERKLILNKY